MHASYHQSYPQKMWASSVASDAHPGHAPPALTVWIMPVHTAYVSTLDHHLITIIQAAGWPIWPLIMCSVVGLALIVERAWVLRQPTVTPPGLPERVIKAWVQRGAPGALAACDNSSMGRILAAAIAAGPQPAAMTQAGAQAGRLQVALLNKHLSGIATVASIAPFLGLLGTVIGMIDMFNAQAIGQAGQADPAALAAGIAIALYNTAFGLMVAVPALLAWRVLRARVDAMVMQLELGTEQVLHMCSKPQRHV
jgi:biopolymer transport protein ExbB